jgi:glycosyltransferase involved in cell wall biosynthesis
MSEPGRKKVLILTYYWPPGGGAGVQRWLKFTKYMREFNYEPVIYTAENPEYPSIDESLYKDVPDNLTVLKTRVWEPYNLYKRFTLKKKGHRINAGFLNKDEKKGPGERISVWIRGNWFIPDARKFWIKPSIRYLIRYLKDHPVSLLVSTGPPHSLHMIACGVAGRMKLPWVADFRDPWTQIDFYQDLLLGPRADRKHRLLERKVLMSANAVTVISNEMKRQFEGMGGNNIRVIPNGFDPDDFDDPVENQDRHSGRSPDPEFSLTHIGTIVPSRNPETLWRVLSELVTENKDLAEHLIIRMVGAIDYSVSRSLEEANLGPWVRTVNYLPHQEAVGLLKSSQVLLLLINNTSNAKGILTGKFFEYMNSGRPILAIGPTDGEAAQILKETGTGKMVDFNDRNNLKNLIFEYFNNYRQGGLNINAKNINKYSRKNLTGSMTELFTELLSTT